MRQANNKCRCSVSDFLSICLTEKKSSVVGRRPWTLAPERMIFGFSNLGTRGKNLTSENDGSSNDLLNGYFEV
jgi:hypothetical protein